MNTRFSHSIVFISFLILMGHAFTPHDHKVDAETHFVSASCDAGGFLHLLAGALSIDIGGEHLEDYQAGKLYQVDIPVFSNACIRPELAPILAELVECLPAFCEQSPPAYSGFLGEVRPLRAPPLV